MNHIILYVAFLISWYTSRREPYHKTPPPFKHWVLCGFPLPSTYAAYLSILEEATTYTFGEAWGFTLQGTTFAEIVAKSCGAIEALYTTEVLVYSMEAFVASGLEVKAFALALLEMLTKDNAELSNVPNECTPEPWASRLGAETLQYTVGEWFDTGVQQVRIYYTTPMTCGIEVQATELK